MMDREISYPPFVRKMVQAYALFGGVLLILAALVTVISVGTRAVGLEVISGDFELIELATGIAVFSFLPWGHMTDAHVRVDVLAARFGPRVFRVLGGISDGLVALIATVILWRFYLGFAEKFPYGSEAFRSVFSMGSKPFYPETTYELQIQIWLPYGFCLIGAALFALVAILKFTADIKGKKP
ncbi:TRAP transporter small permease [Falsihalocynthiibacter sp. S25ZX9]|uniref:TRAP transporter small permease n=1 Tax=Falsihalocynthiibacter sp. S25ZX9 TaxID=3240870 RepID=UPI003510563F